MLQSTITSKHCRANEFAPDDHRVKVTRIAYSKRLNQGKYQRLVEIAQHLGKLRAEVWQRYGSVQGVGLTQRQIRDPRPSV